MHICLWAYADFMHSALCTLHSALSNFSPELTLSTVHRDSRVVSMSITQTYDGMNKTEELSIGGIEAPVEAAAGIILTFEEE